MMENLALLAGGMLGLLALNTVLAQDAFRLHALDQEQKALHYHKVKAK